MPYVFVMERHQHRNEILEQIKTVITEEAGRKASIWKESVMLHTYRGEPKKSEPIVRETGERSPNFFFWHNSVYPPVAGVS